MFVFVFKYLRTTANKIVFLRDHFVQLKRKVKRNRKCNEGNFKK